MGLPPSSGETLARSLMPIAPDLSALKRRLDRYFWANRSAEMTLLNQLLTAHFGTFDRVAVIGGLVRDFAREGRAGFRSDVDLVIDASAGRVAEVAKKLGAAPNRFGGYGFRGGPWRIDFWALETTWAARHAGVPVVRLDDVIRCTFFDWDAIAYDLQAKRLICSQNYLDRIRRGALDINLRPTPSPEGNLLRSMRRLVLWRLYPGPALRSFIEEHLDELTFRAIQIKECQIYPSSVTSIWKNAEAARQELLEDGQRRYLHRQFKLDVPVYPVNRATPIFGRNRKTEMSPSQALRLPGL